MKISIFKRLPDWIPITDTFNVFSFWMILLSQNFFVNPVIENVASVITILFLVNKECRISRCGCCSSSSRVSNRVRNILYFNVSMTCPVIILWWSVNFGVCSRFCLFTTLKVWQCISVTDLNFRFSCAYF